MFTCYLFMSSKICWYATYSCQHARYLFQHANYVACWHNLSYSRGQNYTTIIVTRIVLTQIFKWNTIYIKTHLLHVKKCIITETGFKFNLSKYCWSVEYSTTSILCPELEAVIFVLLKLLRHRTSIFPISSKKTRPISAPLTTSDKFQGPRT